MPFYIFKISASDELEYIDAEEKYRPARDRVKALRKKSPADTGASFRMIFASSVAQGETLLTSSAKDDRIIGDD